MALILHIDTATALASVSLAKDGKLLQQRENNAAMDHASWIHAAIQEIIPSSAEHGLLLAGLDAVAVVAGPGSYTGLRVGMATAKGFCYALQLPLLKLNTLALLAHATIRHNPSSLHCPMLDARRMEVFTAVYDASLQEKMPACAMVLQQDSFSKWLNQSTVVFSGSGSHKWKEIVQHSNAIFSDVHYNAEDIAALAYESFVSGQFPDLAYTEPIYLKEFYTPQRLQ